MKVFSELSCSMIQVSVVVVAAAAVVVVVCAWQWVMRDFVVAKKDEAQ